MRVLNVEILSLWLTPCLGLVLGTFATLRPDMAACFSTRRFVTPFLLELRFDTHIVRRFSFPQHL